VKKAFFVAAKGSPWVGGGVGPQKNRNQRGKKKDAIKKGQSKRDLEKTAGKECTKHRAELRGYAAFSGGGKKRGTQRPGRKGGGEKLNTKAGRGHPKRCGFSVGWDANVGGNSACCREEGKKKMGAPRKEKASQKKTTVRNRRKKRSIQG